MGQHTWFYKDKELYLKEKELWDKLDEHYVGLRVSGTYLLDDMELLQIQHQLDQISESNDVDEYHNLFRTNKRNKDGSYTDDVIFSRKECFEWIKNPENKVVFNDDEHCEYVTSKLNEFWDKYPDGVIDF